MPYKKVHRMCGVGCSTAAIVGAAIVSAAIVGAAIVGLP